MMRGMQPHGLGLHALPEVTCEYVSKNPCQFGGYDVANSARMTDRSDRSGMGSTDRLRCASR
jgi:hypothetical protein